MMRMLGLELELKLVSYRLQASHKVEGINRVLKSINGYKLPV